METTTKAVSMRNIETTSSTRRRIGDLARWKKERKEAASMRNIETTSSTRRRIGDLARWKKERKDAATSDKEDNENTLLTSNCKSDNSEVLCLESVTKDIIKPIQFDKQEPDVEQTESVDIGQNPVTISSQDSTYCMGTLIEAVSMSMKGSVIEDNEEDEENGNAAVEEAEPVEVCTKQTNVSSQDTPTYTGTLKDATSSSITGSVIEDNEEDEGNDRVGEPDSELEPQTDSKTPDVQNIKQQEHAKEYNEDREDNKAKGREEDEEREDNHGDDREGSKKRVQLKQKIKEALVEPPSQEKLEALFETVDKNGDGSLSLKEVEKAMFQRVAPQFNLKPAIVLRAFQKADLDGNGNIDKDEFCGFVRMLAYFDNMRYVFSVLDTNGDRHLSRQEFMEAADVLDMKDPEQVFDEMNQHMLGYIVFDDFCVWMVENRTNF
ncbi:hypothetical protein ACA910_019381 [Epithemia clementina (nom. ined.)]